MLLAIFFGAALGNVVRGVPLNADGYFFEPLWTNWRVGKVNGILDWYTVLCGVVALVTLTVHGCLYLAMKTEGDLNAARRKRGVRAVAGAGACLPVASLIATLYVQPLVLHNYCKWPVGFVIPVVVIASLLYMFFAHEERKRHGRVPRLLRLHRGHAGGSGVRALSDGAAGEHRPGLQPYHRKHQGRARTGWPSGLSGGVSAWSSPLPTLSSSSACSGGR